MAAWLKWLFQAFFFISLNLASPTMAATVVVDGQSYDIQIFPQGSTFNDNVAILETNPWWDPTLTTAEQRALSTQFATAYFSQVGSSTFNNTGEAELLLFTHRVFFNGARIVAESTSLAENGATGGNQIGLDESVARWYFAYVSAPVPVPEINAGAFVLFLYIVGTIYIGLRVRRRNWVESEVSEGPVPRP